ncbi:5-carboxymethyl-2-hydroxymuconate Delta-isomerase [Pseudohalocynthiibacter sp. F2068]|jgi:5-carboxymethyl-2-hydroxymuconate isomerase|uniref:5-carboxymethyl-2-hydroxymuconate Delta-isomerase n=1 Tax=Pseudohalocynthiibacter sp. F2068 TaxID=2926418 RepID=UPI001FF676D1|nr:5-carboxymethyl-2-hydroxymuconate Delta-isomerase [Pseudohalocynthiibacter sp. F2068]MCK0102214.1 5-carboxymethyl-2-hydroxymuconate Delta-isomerase [Pseudohalocynthiibacter sp. F2068]
MPHIVVEYSATLDQSHDMQALCEKLFKVACDNGIFPDTGAVKVRALPCPYVYIGQEPQSFAHATVRLLSGRDTESKARLTNLILKALDATLPDVGSLTVDIKDIDRETYAKRVL